MACGRIWSAVLVQMKGSQRSFQPSMKISMAAMRSLTLVKVPRRIAWRVMIPKKISTMFSHDPEVGVKCRVTRLFLSSHRLTSGVIHSALSGADARIEAQLGPNE